MKHEFERPTTEHYGGPQFERCNVCGIRKSEHDCVHHYLLDEPHGATVAGRCKKCDAVGEWPAYEPLNFVLIDDGKKRQPLHLHRKRVKAAI